MEKGIYFSNIGTGIILLLKHKIKFMKRVLLSALIVLASLSFVKAQDITVKPGKASFSVGSKDAFIVEVYESDVKTVTKQWKKFLKDHKGKVKAKDEIFGDDLKIKALSGNTCDVYSKIVDKGSKVIEIRVGVDLGGAFLSQSAHPDKYPVFEGLLKNFAVEATKGGVLLQKKEQEKILSKKQKELKKLGSDKERLEKEIENYKKNIKKNEEEIEKKKEEIENKKKEIEEQKQEVGKLIEKEKNIK